MPSEPVHGLLTLNDDCLLYIFRFISSVDLGSIKGTCKRLNQLADQSFRLHGNKSLTITVSSMFADIWILKHFGKFIHSLSLDSFYRRFVSHGKILEMIAQYTGEQLKSISFCDCKIDEAETFDCLKDVLGNVECISLKWFMYDKHIELILGYCENLKKIHIDGELMILKSDWCSKNASLTHLTLSGLLDDTILEEVCQKLTRLEYLSVDCVGTATNKIINLGRLTHLRELKIEAYRVDIDQAFRNFKNKNVLEYLCLSYADMTEPLASVLGDFPNLKKLVFENSEGFDKQMQNILSKKLVNIEELTFNDCEKITFNAVTTIIENHLNLKKLSVSGCEKIEFIDRNQYLRLRKKRNLQIFLNPLEYTITFELIKNYLSDYVQIKSFENDY